MSSPEFDLVYAPRALRDIRSVLQYTAQTWGERQHGIYREKLRDAFLLLQERPLAAPLSSDLGGNRRVFVVGSHVVVYRVKDRTVNILRVVHQNMSLSKRL